MGGEVGANIQKVYSYGHRNGFGMAFDPLSAAALWETENADDAYSELNRVVPGMNGGWIQFAGPLSRIADCKVIETTLFGSALQQVRYPPTRVAYTRGRWRCRGCSCCRAPIYVDPEFSWKYEIGPSGTTFVSGNALGRRVRRHAVDRLGAQLPAGRRQRRQPVPHAGSPPDRLHVDVSADPRLADRVADNLFRAQKFDGTESETGVSASQVESARSPPPAARSSTGGRCRERRRGARRRRARRSPRDRRAA